MNRHRVLLPAFLVVALMVLLATGRAQVGQGILDLNAVPEPTLATLPGFTPAIAKAFVAARPFGTIVEANTFLVGQKVAPDQLAALYGKAFVHLNLNTTTGPEILLIPKIAKRMTREFEEYRPWVSMAQFDKEIGKYVDADRGEPAQVLRVHPDRLEYGHRRAVQDDSESARQHAARVQGIPAVEDQGPIRQGDWQIRRRERGRAPLALRGN